MEVLQLKLENRDLKAQCDMGDRDLKDERETVKRLKSELEALQVLAFDCALISQ